MNNLFNLDGQTALVTGASRGLGKEMALALAEAGANVVIGSRTLAEIQQAAAEIAAATSRQVVGCVLDVTDRQSVEAMVTQAMERFGRLDILVNNAGLNIRAPIEQITDEDWHQVQQINITGVFYGCRAVVPHMKEAGYGRIINLGSTLSHVGLADRVNYTAAKGAVMQMTRTLGVELAKTGITVNAICPGPFATEMNRPVFENPQASAVILGRVPMERWGELHEIRAPLLFLASPAASFVTGTAVMVDGGWTAQ